MIDKNNVEQLTIKQKIKLVLGRLAVISCKNDKTVHLTFADTSGITDRLEGGQAKYTQVPIYFDINNAFMVSLSPQITSDKIKPCMDIIRENCRVFENVINDFVRMDKARVEKMSAAEKTELECIIKEQGGALIPNYFKELDSYLEKFTDEKLEGMNKTPTTNEMIDDLSAMLFFRRGMGPNIFFLPYNGKMNDALYTKALKSKNKQFFEHNSWTFYFSSSTALAKKREIEGRIKANFESYNFIFEIIEESIGMKKAPKFIAYARSTEPLEQGK